MRKFAVILVLLSAVPLFATEPNPSPRQRELIGELLHLTRSDQAGHAVMITTACARGGSSVSVTSTWARIETA